MGWFDDNTYTPLMSTGNAAAEAWASGIDPQYANGGGFTGGTPGLTGVSNPNQQGVSTGTTDTSGFGSLMTPFTGTYQAPASPNYASFSPTAFNGPAAYQKPADFTSPTANEMTIDPSYQFRLQQGQQALENSNAARGLNTGATAKGLLDYGQGAASQEYQNIYTRALQNYQTNANLGMASQNQAYNQALQPWQQQNQMALQGTEANNAAATQGFQNQQSNALNAYNTAYQTNAYNQQTPYNMLMGVAQLGSQNANNSANLGANYANTYGNVLGNNAQAISGLYGQQGNAQASGTVGAANSWTGALGGVGNAAQGSSLYNLLLGNQQKPSTNLSGEAAPPAAQPWQYGQQLPPG